MADTGARPAEAVAVEWRHVDLDAGTAELPA
jgi:integrase